MLQNTLIQSNALIGINHLKILGLYLNKQNVFPCMDIHFKDKMVFIMGIHILERYRYIATDTLLYIGTATQTNHKLPSRKWN